MIARFVGINRAHSKSHGQRKGRYQAETRHRNTARCCSVRGASGTGSRCKHRLFEATQPPTTSATMISPPLQRAEGPCLPKAQIRLFRGSVVRFRGFDGLWFERTWSAAARFESWGALGAARALLRGPSSPANRRTVTHGTEIPLPGYRLLNSKCFRGCDM